MSIFGTKKRRIPVSKDDIKKAIRAANDRFKRVNKRLEQDIVDKKKSLSSIGKEVSVHNKELKSIASEIGSAKSDAIGTKKEASKERVKLSKLKKQLTEALADKDIAQSELNNLTKESKILDKKVVKMNDDLAIVSSIKGELKLLKSDKKEESEELKKIKSEADGIKKELSKLRAESTAKKEVHRELLSTLDAETEIKQKALKAVDGEYAIKIAELNTKFISLEEALKDKAQEDEVMDSLIGKKEQEFIEWEVKCRKAEHMLMKAKELADDQIERSKKEIDRQQEAAKRWKVGFFEEIARVKLKKKIENIEMAGLKEAFDG
jgi:chromosome segregation ATPase